MANRRRSVVVLLAVFVLVFLSVVSYAEGTMITAISVSGNQEIDTEEILAVVKASKVGELLVEDNLMADMKAITDLGYFSLVEVEPKFYFGGIRINFKVEENPVIKDIEVKIDTNDVPAEEIIKRLDIPVGKVLNVKKISSEALQGLIEGIANDYGVYIEPADAYIDNNSVFQMSFVTMRVADIKISGLEKTKEQVVRRYVTVKPGDIPKRTELEKIYGKLYNTGYFDSVNIFFEPTEKPMEQTMVIDLKERKSGQLLGGLGYSSVDGILGYLQYQEDNFLGNGQKLSSRVEIGKQKRMLGLSFYEPYLGSSATSFGVDATYTLTKVDNEDGTFVKNDRKGITLSVGRPLSEYLRLSINTTIDNNLEEVSATNTITDWKTRSLGFILSYDDANHFLFPSAGQRIRLTSEFGGKILGGNYSFQKYDADFAKYVKLDKEGKHVLAGHLQAGVITTPDARLPENMKYTLGGSDTVRGYKYGYLDGKSRILSNIEYRYMVTDQIQLVLFADAGQIADTGVKWENFKTGFGPGIRINTPIGPIRLDYGFAKDNGKWNSQFYFSLGQAF